MYEDLNDEEAIELALEHLMRGQPIPAKLRARIGDEATATIEGLYNGLDD